jgi:indolepyruvate ferredoxin oxidoreductase beta subunit
MREQAAGKTVNVVLAGVGGQGSVLAGQILARVAMRAGYSAAASEVHGMAQRGGSVISTVRFGPKVLSPAVPEGEADFLLAFEKLEALRYANVLKPGGVALVNDQRITPTIESLKLAPYPDDADVKAALSERAGTVLLVPGLEIALELGDARLANTVLLGVLSTFLDVSEEAWRQAIADLVPPKTVELNQRAFTEGIRWAEEHAQERYKSALS